MNRTIALLFLAAVISNATGQPRMTPAEVCKYYGSAVVMITTYSAQKNAVGLGSGFIVSNDGLIVTCHHVIDGANHIVVKLLNGSAFLDVSIVGDDAENDVAVLRVKGKDLPSLRLTSSDSVVVGSRVTVIGNPNGLENSVSDGLLSGIRTIGNRDCYQISAPISPGSSGGPVFNENGEVLGIAAATLRDAQNINFCIPAKYARAILQGGRATGIQVSAAGITGSWQGSLVVPGGSLRVVFNITEKPDKTLAATMDSPDQGAKGIPVDEVKLSGDSVIIKASSIGGSYAGKLVSDSAMDGTWTQGGGAFPLAMTRLAKPIEINRPQEPKPPYPYVTEEVSIKNTSAAVSLAGTLTKPKGKGKFPVAVMITGSGPENRDEEIFGHKPFLVLADYLTRNGIAVLRCDDRGVAKSTGDFAKATTRDFSSDVEAEVAYLKTRKDVNPKQVGLIGHSEGAIIAPMVATEFPGIAFVVLMAAPGVTGEEILYRQGALIAKAEGTPDSAIAEQDTLQHRIFAILKSHPDSAGSAVELTKLAAEMDSTAKARGRANDTMLKLAIQQQMKRVQSPWFRFFLTYDPKPSLLKLICPVLAIYGGKDLQVDPAQNMPVLEDAFKTSKHADWLVKELPGLNHLFQTANTGAVSEYSQIEETIAPAALELICSWVSAHTLDR